MAWQPDYVTLAELKAYVRIDDTVDDAEVGFAITAASRAIDLATNRQFGQASSAVDRFYGAWFDRRRRRWTVNIDDLMTETGLVVAFDEDDDESYTAEITDYVLRPRNAKVDKQPWTSVEVNVAEDNQPNSGLDGNVQVTAKFGWSQVPTAIQQATLLQASRFLSRRDAPFGVAGSPETGSEVRLLARVDPDVNVAVAPYRRWWGAA